MQTMPKIPQDRIGVLIGRNGETRKRLLKASGAKRLDIDSESGDVMVEWGEPGTFDPIKAMKLPDVIKAVGRGMAPKRAILLLEDEYYFELIDLKGFVGKRSNQQRRVRGRIIGSNGRIRRLIEQNTGTEISIYGSTVVIVGAEHGLAVARMAVERLAGGAEHGSVISQMERQTRDLRMASKVIAYDEAKEPVAQVTGGFEALVPGLDDVARRRNRRLKAHQVDIEDPVAVSEVMSLEDDESIEWSEE